MRGDAICNDLVSWGKWMVIYFAVDMLNFLKYQYSMEEYTPLLLKI